jgi:membrane fusion protein (multidrug efflux system)
MASYPPRAHSNKRFVIIILLVVALAAVIYFGRHMFGGPQGPQQGGFGIPVETALVESRPLDITIDSVGTLVANESVILRPETTGRITGIKFIEGQPVKKGAVLFQIDDRMARAELKQAQAALQLANLNNDRFSKLSKTGAATKRTYDEARANLGVAQATVDLARARIDYTTIQAPFDGVVGLRNVSPGDYVNMGQDLANFVSYDPMKVNFSIPETQSSKLGVGQLLDITVEAMPGETFHGKVFALDPQLDVSGRAVNLRATIPNADMKLQPGMFARVSLTVSHKDSALIIPESAIVPQGNDKMVFVVGADNKANLTPVTLGERLAGEVEILSGLNAGDVVVTSGQIKLQPGAPVTDLRKMAAEKQAASSPPAASPASAAVAPAPAQEVKEPLATPATEAPLPDEAVIDVPAAEGDDGGDAQ